MMLLHTIVPLEQIFESEPAKTECIELDGAFLEGVRCENGMQVTRLISTDPKRYLDERYAPGALYAASPKKP